MITRLKTREDLLKFGLDNGQDKKIPTPSRPSLKKKGGKNKESTDMIEGGGADGFVNGNENVVFFFFLEFLHKKVGEASEIW